MSDTENTVLKAIQMRKHTAIVVLGFAVLASMVLAFTWAFPEAFQAPTRPALEASAPVVVQSTAAVEPETPQTPTTQYASVEAYFTAGNPNPLTHRFGLPRYERDVSAATKKKVKTRDGNCCVICGSTKQLEVDHRRALMNNGSNSESNLGTLCDSCHTEKTRYDWSIKKRRRKNGERH